MKPVYKTLLPPLTIFAAVTLIIILTKAALEAKGIHTGVLLGANVFFLIVQLLVIAIQRNSLKSDNPNAFIRSTMSGLILKMFTTIGAVLAYYVLSGKSFSEKSVFVALFIYLIYLATEVFTLSKMNRRYK